MGVVIPVLLRLPAMFVAIPPLMVGVPATLPLGVQLMAALFSLVAALAVVANGFIQSRFRLLDCVLAMGSVIRVKGGRGYEPRQRYR